MLLIIEDGTGVVGAESYNSIADADLYHFRMGNTEWPQPPTPTEEDPEPIDPNAERKAAMLRRGAMYLDNMYGLRLGGLKVNPNQGLVFPLIGAFDHFGRPIRPDTVPQVYKDGHNEVALLAYTNVALATNVAAGPILRSKRIDVIVKEWFEGTHGQAPVFGWLDLMLAPLFGPPIDPDVFAVARIGRA